MNAELAAAHITGLKFTDLPPATVAMAKHCLLDYLASAIAGLGFPSIACGHALPAALGAKKESSVLGQARKVPAACAAWANSLLGNVLDFEDGHYPSLSHPGSVVFPAALAFSEKLGRDSREFITATVIGYDILGCAGTLMARRYRERTYGFGAPSVYAAAAVAARLLRLDQKQTEMALGIAGDYMPAIPLRFGAMTKSGGSWASFTGVLAAQLVAGGFTGQTATLQDPYMPEDDATARPYLLKLGREFAIDNVYFKRYPSCRWSHAAMDAVQAILAAHPLKTAQVTDVLVETFTEALTLSSQNPANFAGCQFSVPMLLAFLINDGEYGLAQMSDDRISDPQVRALAAKVRMVVDPKLDKLFPKKRPARVTIKTIEGAAYTQEIREVHGEPGSDFARDGVRKKFFDVVPARFGRAVARRMYELVGNMDGVSALAELYVLLRTRAKVASK